MVKLRGGRGGNWKQPITQRASQRTDVIPEKILKMRQETGLLRYWGHSHPGVDLELLSMARREEPGWGRHRHLNREGCLLAKEAIWKGSKFSTAGGNQELLRGWSGFEALSHKCSEATQTGWCFSAQYRAKREYTETEGCKLYSVSTRITARGTSLAVQGLKLHAPNSGKPGLIPGGGTRSYMQQLKVCMPQELKIPHAAMKIEDQKSWSQTKKK